MDTHHIGSRYETRPRAATGSRPQPPAGVTRLTVTRWVAIAAVFVNLDIHIALAPMHLGEMRYIGVLFVIGSVLLGAVMVGLASDHDSLRTPAWVGGSLVCAAEFILYVASRTTGLPGGYLEGWTGQTEDLLGLASLAVELVFIGCAVASLTRTNRPGSPVWLLVHDRTAPLR